MDIALSNQWSLPTRLRKHDGEYRRVGVEVELQGLPLESISDILVEVVGGTSIRESHVEATVHAPELGEFRIEVDMQLLKKIARERPAGGIAAEIHQVAVSAASDASAAVVPLEIVSPPIEIPKLAKPMDELVNKLRAAGAEGTKSSMLYAFGVHLNVEPFDLEPATLLDYLRAFAVLYPKLIEADETDLARRLTPYIDPFPLAYEQHITNPAYSPDMSELIDDYLEYNPTRDRALDMLPLFAHVDEDRVRAVTDDPLIKPRPTFHYRLANCCIDQPDWNLAVPWSMWMHVERLANDNARLMTLCKTYSQKTAAPRLVWNSLWRKELA